MSPRLAGSSHKALLRMLLGPIVPSHLVAAWWPLLAPFPPLASDFLVDILKTSKHIMSVYGVVCVLGPDRGCVVEAHGVVSPFFLQGLPVFYWVPRIGPGISPGQPSILRQGMPDIRLIGWGGGAAEKAACMGEVCRQLHTDGVGLIKCLAWQTHPHCGRTLKMLTPSGERKTPGPMGTVTAQA